MRYFRAILIAALTLVLAMGCTARPVPTSNPGSPTIDLAHIVQATLSAMTEQAARATAIPSTPTASGAPGSISGSLTYPADTLPAMYVVAFDVSTGKHIYVATHAGEATYEIEKLPPGVYHVVAYTAGGGGFPVGFAEGYTQAVPCGLATECANHALIDVMVGPGERVTGIDPGDGYAPAGSFPPFPEAFAFATAAALSATPTVGTPTP